MPRSAKKASMYSWVPSVDPVSPITQQVIQGATAVRQRSRFAISFFTIMFRQSALPDGGGCARRAAFGLRALRGVGGIRPNPITPTDDHANADRRPFLGPYRSHANAANLELMAPRLLRPIRLDGQPRPWRARRAGEEAAAGKAVCRSRRSRLPKARRNGSRRAWPISSGRRPV